MERGFKDFIPLMHVLGWNVSVLHQNKGGIGKSIPDAPDIS